MAARPRRPFPHPVSAAVAAVVLAASLTSCGGATSLDTSTSPLPGRDAEPMWWTRITLDTTPTTRTITIPSDSFAVGDSTPPPKLKAAIDDIARHIRAEATGPVTIGGATDSLPVEGGNEALGLARARNTADALRAAGIAMGTGAGEIASVVSLADRQPVCTPETDADGRDRPDCRARNRRVVITYSTQVPSR